MKISAKNDLSAFWHGRRFPARVGLPSESLKQPAALSQSRCLRMADRSKIASAGKQSRERRMSLSSGDIVLRVPGTIARAGILGGKSGVKRNDSFASF